MKYYFNPNDPVIRFVTALFKYGMIIGVVMMAIGGVMDYFDLF